MEGDTNRSCPEKRDDALGLLQPHGGLGCSGPAPEFILFVLSPFRHVFREAGLAGEAEVVGSFS